MTRIIHFTVPGEVRGKGRPRATKRGAHIKLYTDEKTASYENRVALAAKGVMGDRPLIAGAVSIKVLAVIAIPRSWSKKKQAEALQGRVRPTGKPDADNVLKALCDGLNGVVWRDDAQVVEAWLRKSYGEAPGAQITIVELTESAE